MKHSIKYTKRLKKYAAPLVQFNPYLLSTKSCIRLLFRRKKQYNSYNYPLLITSGLQRSGTHLVNNLLRDHHQILSYYGELQIGRPNKYHWPDLQDKKNISKRFDALMPRNLARKYLSLKKYHKSKSEHEDFVFDFILFRKLFLQLEIKNEIFDQRTTLNNFFTAYFNAYLNCSHSNFYDKYKYIVAPVPGITIIKSSMENFFRDYSDGKIFILIRDPYIWWNSARNHTKNLKNNGLDRYEKTLKNTIWAHEKYKNNVFAISFDYLIKNTEQAVDAILKHAGLDFDETAKYPSKFPAYANDNSTFGHKKTKAIVKDKIKREVNIPEEDRSHIKMRIYPLYEKVLENCIINPLKS